MDDPELKKYRKEQNQRRLKQLVYGNKIFSMPWSFKYKIKAYRKMFNIGEHPFIGDEVLFIRAHRIIGAGTVSVGKNVKLGSRVTIDYSGKVVIGDGVDLSSGVKIFSHTHDTYEMVHSNTNVPKGETTIISDHAWVGTNSIIMAGVTIGEYAVVGAGSIVTKDVPANCIYAGNPAKFIRENKPSSK